MCPNISHCIYCGSTEIEILESAFFFSGAQAVIKCNACEEDFGVRPDEGANTIDA